MSGSTAGRIVTRSKLGRKTAQLSRPPRGGCPAIVQLRPRAGHFVVGVACRETCGFFLKSLLQTLCERWPCASGMRSAVEQAGELCRDCPRAEGGRHINFGARVSGLEPQRSPCVGVWLLACGTTVRGYPAPKLFFALRWFGTGPPSLTLRVTIRESRWYAEDGAPLADASGYDEELRVTIRESRWYADDGATLVDA